MDSHYMMTMNFLEDFFLKSTKPGLNWETILKKEQSFRKAYAGFDIGKVAVFTESDVKRLLSDTGIIRNRLKINAAIYNANTILKI